MQAVIVLFACLASATAVLDIPRPVKFPPRVGGASKRVREVLCPMQVEISGIGKRALGCTVDDIFGGDDLSTEYVEKLRHWAAKVSEEAEKDEDLRDFKPKIKIHQNVANKSKAGVDKMYHKAKDGPEDIKGVVWTDDYFGPELIPPPIEVNDDYKVWDKKAVVKDAPYTKEEEKAIINVFETPGWKADVEISQDEMPWNVKAQPKDIHTKTTTPNPFVDGRDEMVEPSLLPWNTDFKKPSNGTKIKIYGKGRGRKGKGKTR